MIDLQSIKHISFDLWLTLIKSNSKFKHLRSELLIKHFSIQIEKEKVFDVVNEYDRLFNSINETLGRNFDTYEIILIILHNLGVDTQKVTLESLDAFYVEMEALFMKYHPVLIDSHTETILSNLRAKGITLNILSNTGFIKGKSVNKVLHKLGIADYFDFCIYSDELGYSKPSTLAFKSVFSSVQTVMPLSKEQILHIGDNVVADYNGAKKFGFMAHLVNVNDITLTDILF